MFGFFCASTIVIAAVSVVFPWSTCPIVPTFTCGFVRWNFCLPMKRTSRIALTAESAPEGASSFLTSGAPHATRARGTPLSLRLRHDLLRDCLRQGLVAGELHRV